MLICWGISPARQSDVIWMFTTVDCGWHYDDFRFKTKKRWKSWWPVRPRTWDHWMFFVGLVAKGVSSDMCPGWSVLPNLLVNVSSAIATGHSSCMDFPSTRGCRGRCHAGEATWWPRKRCWCPAVHGWWPGGAYGIATVSKKHVVNADCVETKRDIASQPLVEGRLRTVEWRADSARSYLIIL